ncbi:hypothetical protein CALCODRAFT_413094, partial [Calocera cornea HHB12733]
ISPNMPESMMPLRSSRNAPVLESARPEHIVRFLEDVQQLCEGHEVSPEKWVDYSLKYVDIDVAQVWESLPESKAVPTDFAAFRKAVLRLYPGSTDDTRRYTKTDLERIVSKSAAIPMESRAQFGEYYRQFLMISTWLEEKGKISTMERAQQYMRGFHFDFQEKLRTRLMMKQPDVLPGDPYDIEHVTEAAEFLL